MSDLEIEIEIEIEIETTINCILYTERRHARLVLKT